LTDRSINKYRSMSPKSEEQFEEIRQSKTKLIKATALELFALNGYENTSISKIAKEAAISKGLLYNYFDSKEELLKEIIFEQMDMMLKLFDPNKDGVLETDELKYFIHESFSMVKKNPEFWRLYFMLLFQPNVMKLIEKRVMEIAEPILANTTDYFKRQGYEKPEVWTRYIGALLDGVSMNYIADPVNFPIDDIENIVINQFCNTSKNTEK